MSDITLQINLSSGDCDYAEMTVPALVDAHRALVAETMAVVDHCKPQRTRMTDPEKSFPEPGFSGRVQRISEIAEDLASRGYLDRIVHLRPGDPCIAEYSKKYFSRLITETHSFCAAGLMSYILGVEQASTRHVLHYDCDMLLHQQDGYDWALEAREYMARNDMAGAVTPRIYPFDPASPDASAELYKGNIMPTHLDAWYNDWFSARCFLLDRERLWKVLPLVQWPYVVEVMVRRVLNRSYPPDFEGMVSLSMTRCGYYKCYLKSQKAWLLHPADKKAKFMVLLPRIIESVRLGNVPAGQYGLEDLRLDVWERYFASSEASEAE